MPSYHPGILGDNSQAHQYTSIEGNTDDLKQALSLMGLTVEQITDSFPTIKSFMIMSWPPNSKGEAENIPRNIRFIDGKGSGFTLGLNTSWGDGIYWKWYTSWIWEYRIRYESTNHYNFNQMASWIHRLLPSNVEPQNTLVK